MLLLVDIGLLLLFTFGFVQFARKETGAGAILLPEAFLYLLTKKGLLGLTVINLLLVWLLSFSLWQALVPFGIYVLVFFIQYTTEKRNQLFYKKHISPLKQKIETFMKERGYNPARISVNPPQKRMHVELYKEDAERFYKEEKQINEEFKTLFATKKFASYRASIFINTHKKQVSKP